MNPEAFGQYKILEKIGAGSLGDLYRARDTRVGRTVALRVISPSIAGDPGKLGEFLADARASAAVSHPNIAALYDVGQDAGLHYLACEFVPGQNLKTLVSGRPLNPRRAVDLTIQIADALADAYAGDMVHGDLRADTIFVNAKGNAKLLDFGLAHWSSGARTGARDHRADIAALGLILHEMLTGTMPAHGRALRDVDSHLPRELDAVLRKTQAADDGNGYEASATLAAELRAIAAILDVRAQTASEAAVSPPKGARRREAIVWVLALALIGVLAWLIWTASHMG